MCSSSILPQRAPLLIASSDHVIVIHHKLGNSCTMVDKMYISWCQETANSHDVRKRGDKIAFGKHRCVLSHGEPEYVGCMWHVLIQPNQKLGDHS
jgi:hypothetical protein